MAPLFFRIKQNPHAGMIDAWIAEHGVRGFAIGDGGAEEALAERLRAEGYRVWTYKGQFRVSNGRGRPKQLSRGEAIKLIDEIRAQAGLEPLGPRRERNGKGKR